MTAAAPASESRSGAVIDAPKGNGPVAGVEAASEPRNRNGDGSIGGCRRLSAPEGACPVGSRGRTGQVPPRSGFIYKSPGRRCHGPRRDTRR
jgi:hypothetical protein